MKHVFEQGFTLLEMIIYVAIFIIVSAGLFSLTNNIIASRVNYQMANEVNNQGSQIINVITQTIRNGTEVDIPSEAVLIIDGITFSEQNGTLYFTESIENPVALSNDKVRMSNLEFLELSRENTSNIVRIRFTLTSGNDYFSNDFYGTAGTRK